MKNEKPIYHTDFFCTQLQKIRLYRDFHSQAQLSDSLDIPRQTFHLWEKGDRFPNIGQLIKLCNFLNVDINYFFCPDATPEEHDLNRSTLSSQVTRDFSPEMINSMHLMPFVDTHVSHQLFKIFDSCLTHKGCYSIDVSENSGVTRTLHEYLIANINIIKIIEEYNFFEEILEKKRDSLLLLFDNADRLPEKLLKMVLETFSQDYPGSIVLLGKNIRTVLAKHNYLNQITRSFTSDAITTTDFNHIAKGALPKVSADIISLLRIETGVRLKQLYKVINKIHNKRKLDAKFALTPDSVLKLSDEDL